MKNILMKKILMLIAALSMAACSTPNKDAASNAPAFQGQIAAAEIDRALASAESAGSQKCASRVRAAGCTLSNNDFDRIDDYVAECKHVVSSSGKTELEIFRLADAGKVVVVKTKATVGKCDRNKFTINSSGINEIKVIGNKVFMYSKDGHLYFMNPDESFYEVMKGNGNPYVGIRDIKGVQGSNSSIQLIFQNGTDFTMSESVLHERPKKKINFVTVNTDRSLFRDE